MKRVIGLLLVFAMLLCAVPTGAAGEIQIYVNGERLECDTAPYIKNGRTMVPMRAIFEALGATVDWNHTEKIATGKRDGIEIAIKIGDRVLYKNGIGILIDAEAEITNQRTMVPVRAISEAFGCNVKWIDETRTAWITEEEKLTKSQELLLSSHLHADREEAKKAMRVLDKSIEADEYTLTVNEVMGDAMQMYMTVSITAKNAKAKSVLLAEQFNWITVEGSKGDGKWFKLDGGSKSEMEGERRIFVISNSSALYGAFPFVRVGWKRFKTGEYVEFEMENVLEEIKLQLKGLGNDESYIMIQPMRIEIMVPAGDVTAPRSDIDTFFTMRDGRIVTLSQLCGGNSSSHSMGNNMYKHTFNTRSVLELNEFESVIVKGNKYSIDNANEYTTVEIPEEMKPFVVAEENRLVHNYVHYSVDIDFLAEKLKMEITDRTADMIEVVYFGRTYTLRADSIYAEVDGEQKYALHALPYWHTDGTIWVTYDFLTKVLGMRMEYLDDSIMFVP